MHLIIQKLKVKIYVV